MTEVLALEGSGLLLAVELSSNVILLSVHTSIRLHIQAEPGSVFSLCPQAADAAFADIGVAGNNPVRGPATWWLREVCRRFLDDFLCRPTRPAAMLGERVGGATMPIWGFICAKCERGCSAWVSGTTLCSTCFKESGKIQPPIEQMTFRLPSQLEIEAMARGEIPMKIDTPPPQRFEVKSQIEAMAREKEAEAMARGEIPMKIDIPRQATMTLQEFVTDLINQKFANKKLEPQQKANLEREVLKWLIEYIEEKCLKAMSAEDSLTWRAMNKAGVSYEGLEEFMVAHTPNYHTVSQNAVQQFKQIYSKRYLL